MSKESLPMARFSFSRADAFGLMTLKFSPNALSGMPEDILDALNAAAESVREVLSGHVEAIRGDVVTP